MSKMKSDESFSHKNYRKFLETKLLKLFRKFLEIKIRKFFRKFLEIKILKFFIKCLEIKILKFQFRNFKKGLTLDCCEDWEVSSSGIF